MAVLDLTDLLVRVPSASGGEEAWTETDIVLPGYRDGHPGVGADAPLPRSRHTLPPLCDSRARRRLRYPVGSAGTHFVDVVSCFVSCFASRATWRVVSGFLRFASRLAYRGGRPGMPPRTSRDCRESRGHIAVP